MQTMQDSMLRMTLALLEPNCPWHPWRQGILPSWESLTCIAFAFDGNTEPHFRRVVDKEGSFFFSLSRLPWSDHDAKNLITAINTELE